MFQLLVVEDNRELREMFCMVLTENGYTTLQAGDGEEALNVIAEHYVDLMITDVMMPGMDGFELSRDLRNAGYTFPILMITAKGEQTDKRDGFLAGTDDYMVKPVDVNEMLWRVSALLRRVQSINERTLHLGDTTLQCDSLTVCDAQGSVLLPQKEFFLLLKLLASPGRIFTRKQIMDEIWGVDAEADPHTLEVHISRLRDRFRDNKDFEIVTVRGLGYKAVQKNEQAFSTNCYTVFATDLFGTGFNHAYYRNYTWRALPLGFYANAEPFDAVRYFRVSQCAYRHSVIAPYDKACFYNHQRHQRGHKSGGQGGFLCATG